MSGDANVPRFVPVVLTEIECHAVAAACGAVVAGSPVRLSVDHPLLTAALKINDAVRAAPVSSEPSNRGAR